MTPSFHPHTNASPALSTSASRLFCGFVHASNQHHLEPEINGSICPPAHKHTLPKGTKNPGTQRCNSDLDIFCSSCSPDLYCRSQIPRKQAIILKSKGAMPTFETHYRIGDLYL